MPSIERRANDSTFHFDRTINLGHLFTVITFVVTMFMAYSGIVRRMDIMELKVDAMWQQFKIVINDAK